MSSRCPGPGRGGGRWPGKGRLGQGRCSFRRGDEKVRQEYGGPGHSPGCRSRVPPCSNLYMDAWPETPKGARGWGSGGWRSHRGGRPLPQRPRRLPVTTEEHNCGRATVTSHRDWMSEVNSWTPRLYNLYFYKIFFRLCLLKQFKNLKTSNSKHVNRRCPHAAI